MDSEKTPVVCIARSVLLLCAALGVIAGPANAQLVQTECKTYFRLSNAPLPTEIAAYFADSEKDVVDTNERQLLKQFAVTRCKRQYARRLYILEYPVQRDNGVCHFKQSDISHLFDPNGQYLGEKAPEIRFKDHPSEMMVVSGMPCPTQDFADYIETYSLPPGVFHSIMAFWTMATSSEAEINKAFFALPRDPQVPSEWEKIRKAEFDKFKSVLRGRIGKPLPIRSVGPSLNILPQGTSYYEIRFTDPAIENHGWGIGIDLTETGWTFVHFDAWIA